MCDGPSLQQGELFHGRGLKFFLLLMSMLNLEAHCNNSRYQKMVFKDAGNDPSLRMLRSSLGRQVTSPHETFPQWGFGTGDRNAASKVRDASASNANINADEKETRNHLDR